MSNWHALTLKIGSKEGETAYSGRLVTGNTGVCVHVRMVTHTVPFADKRFVLLSKRQTTRSGSVWL